MWYVNLWNDKNVTWGSVLIWALLIIASLLALYLLYQLGGYIYMYGLTLDGFKIMWLEHREKRLREIVNAAKTANLTDDMAIALAISQAEDRLLVIDNRIDALNCGLLNKKMKKAVKDVGLIDSKSAKDIMDKIGVKNANAFDGNSGYEGGCGQFSNPEPDEDDCGTFSDEEPFVDNDDILSNDEELTFVADTETVDTPDWFGKRNFDTEKPDWTGNIPATDEFLCGSDIAKPNKSKSHKKHKKNGIKGSHNSKKKNKKKDGERDE